MRKQEFLDALRAHLSSLPRAELEEQLIFYSEMIDDRIEEGLSEEEAVAAIGSAEEIAAQILSESSGAPKAKKDPKATTPKRRLRTWEIVLLAVGSPLWIVLGAAALIVLLALYIVLWSLVASVWAVFGALVGGGFGGLASGILVMILGRAPVGLVLIAAACICVGLSIFLFFGCLAATKGSARLTKLGVLGIYRCFVKKEERV